MDDWQPGDLALCVRIGAIPHRRSGMVRPPASRLRKGRIYTVQSLRYARPGYLDFGELALRLQELPEERGFCAERFVKVTPEEADEQDRITIELLTGAPVKEPV